MIMIRDLANFFLIHMGLAPAASLIDHRQQTKDGIQLIYHSWYGLKTTQTWRPSAVGCITLMMKAKLIFRIIQKQRLADLTPPSTSGK